MDTHGYRNLANVKGSPPLESIAELLRLQQLLRHLLSHSSYKLLIRQTWDHVPFQRLLTETIGKLTNMTELQSLPV